MRGQYWIPKQEELITDWEHQCIFNALDRGFSVIVDATNLNPKYLTDLKVKISSKYLVEFEIKFFNTPLEQCIERDLKRPNSVGEKVIRNFYSKYLKVKEPKYISNPNLPRAIICDLDGTLCLLNGRDPYNASTCHEDLLNPIVAELIKDKIVLLVSGREDKYKEQTLQFLNNHNIVYKELYMRKSGDFRKDTIIKREIFDTYIRDNYNIQYVLDDRNSVVEMWRELGLTCLQVAEGDF